MCPQHGQQSHLPHQTACLGHFAAHRVPKILVTQNVVLWKEFWRNAFFLASESFAKMSSMCLFESLSRIGTLIYFTGAEIILTPFLKEASAGLPPFSTAGTAEVISSKAAGTTARLCASFFMESGYWEDHHACKEEIMRKGNSLRLTSLLVSSGCYNKLLQFWWVQTREIYSFKVPENRQNQGVIESSPSKGHRAEFFLALPVSGGSTRSSACGCITPNSASIFTRPFHLRLCVSKYPSSFSYKGNSH